MPAQPIKSWHVGLEKSGPPVQHGMTHKSAEPKGKRRRAMLGLDPREAATNGADGELGGRRRVGIVEAEEEVEVIMAEAIEAGIPAKGSHGKGMTDVVVAVTEGTLIVLLGLTPKDGEDSTEKDRAAVIEEKGREVEAGVELEGVVFGGVVGEERGGGERGSHRRGEAAKGGGLWWGGGCHCWG